MHCIPHLQSFIVEGAGKDGRKPCRTPRWVRRQLRPQLLQLQCSPKVHAAKTMIPSSSPQRLHLKTALDWTQILTVQLMLSHLPNSIHILTILQASKSVLLRLFMRRMLFAELAVFVEFQTIRVVLLVFIGLVVAVFANCAGQCNCVTHPMHSFTSLRADISKTPKR